MIVHLKAEAWPQKKLDESRAVTIGSRGGGGDQGGAIARDRSSGGGGGATEEGGEGRGT